MSDYIDKVNVNSVLYNIRDADAVAGTETNATTLATLQADITTTGQTLTTAQTSMTAQITALEARVTALENK